MQKDLEGSKCPLDMMMNIECRTVSEHLSPKETGLDVECNLDKGLVCISRPGQTECPDFEISILCGCGTCKIWHKILIIIVFCVIIFC